MQSPCLRVLLVFHVNQVIQPLFLYLFSYYTVSFQSPSISLIKLLIPQTPTPSLLRIPWIHRSWTPAVPLCIWGSKYSTMGCRGNPVPGWGLDKLETAIICSYLNSTPEVAQIPDSSCYITEKRQFKQDTQGFCSISLSSDPTGQYWAMSREEALPHTQQYFYLCHL